VGEIILANENALWELEETGKGRGKREAIGTIGDEKKNKEKGEEREGERKRLFKTSTLTPWNHSSPRSD